MSTMMDIVFSTILGGVVLLITLNANAIISDTWFVYNGDVLVQNMLTATAQVVESEIRNMGCGLAVGKQSLTIATDTCIQFQLKLRTASTKIDSIKYYSGSVTEMSFSENPRDRYLYRQFDGQSPRRIGVISQFKLKYYDNLGAEISTPIPQGDLTDVQVVEITLEIQNPYAIYRDPKLVKPGEYDALYSTSVWKQTRLASQNLRR